jgi:adenine-specific DNA-methyltransferase
VIAINAPRDAPETEGIKYAGSKLRLLPFILRLARRVPAQTVFDGFSGTTRVSQAFARLGYRVIANDRSAWSRIFGQCYLKNRREADFYREILRHLNTLPGTDGWFTENYGANRLKKPFQIHNLRRLDAIRGEIDCLNLPETEKAVVLTSLVLALDAVDSTLGHFASYLKDWSPRSYQDFQLKVPRLIESNEDNEVYCGDVFDALERVEADLAYFDPPYGSNNEKMPPSRVRYAAYYHFWTTVCLNDEPELFGKAGRRADSSDQVAGSVFEDFRRGESGRFVVVEAIEKVLRHARARFVILSYSSGGRATAAELYEILENAGKILEVVKIDYRRNVMASMRRTHEWIRESEKTNQEYLFLIEK